MKVNICRLCLQADNPMAKLIRVSDCSSNGTIMEVLIKQYINIELHSEIRSIDAVDTVICHDCRTVIESWDNFQKSCIANDARFREILTNVLHDATVAKDEVEVADQQHESLVGNESECATDVSDTELTAKKDHQTIEVPESNETDGIAVADATQKTLATRSRGRPSIKRVEKSDMRAGVCTVCGELRKNIYEHMKTHSTRRPYTCPHCPLTFRNASNCKSHINIHTREKVYKCDICDKEYAMRNGLKQHLATHAKSRDYLCHCGKSFYQRTAYARHARKHVEKPKVKCTECTMLFFSNAEMRYHFQKHKGDTFYCEVCGRGFYRKSNLNKHESMHHKPSGADNAPANPVTTNF